MFFGLLSLSTGAGRGGRRWTRPKGHAALQYHSPGPEAPLTRRAVTDAGELLKRALVDGNRRPLLRGFLTELRKLHDDQSRVLSVLEGSREWSLAMLNRQFFAVRSVAHLLGSSNLAFVAGRGEVLVNLLGLGTLSYGPNHGSVIRETHHLLGTMIDTIAQTGSDQSCYAITQTVWCIHAALDERLCDYEPVSTEDPVAQSISHLE